MFSSKSYPLLIYNHQSLLCLSLVSFAFLMGKWQSRCFLLSDVVSSLINVTSVLHYLQLWLSSYPQSYVQQSADGRSLAGLAGGGNASASPELGDLYANGSFARLQPAAATGSPQTGSIAALARIRNSFFLSGKNWWEFLVALVKGRKHFLKIIILFPIPEDMNGSIRWWQTSVE